MLVPSAVIILPSPPVCLSERFHFTGELLRDTRAGWYPKGEGGTTCKCGRLDIFSGMCIAQHRKSIFLASSFNVIFTSIKAFTRVYRFCGGRQALVLCRENRLAPLTCLAILQPACSVIYHFLWLLKRCQFLWTVCVGWYTNTIHLTHYCIILPFVQCRCDLSYMLCGNFPVTLIVTTWESLPRAGNS